MVIHDNSEVFPSILLWLEYNFEAEYFHVKSQNFTCFSLHLAFEK